MKFTITISLYSIIAYFLMVDVGAILCEFITFDEPSSVKDVINMIMLILNALILVIIYCNE